MTELAPHPNLDIGTAAEGGDVRLTLHGELDRSTSWALTAAMIRAERHGADRVVIDMGDVHFLDAGGLRALADAARRGRRLPHGVLVDHPTASVARLLHLTGLDRTLETH